jgi:hypothetical protein
MGEMTPYEHLLKDYLLAPSFLIPTFVSLAAAFWAWRTSRGLERLKADLNERLARVTHELERDLKVHETTLRVAAEIESRFHENDLVALRECQKGVSQLFVQCTETLWQIAHNADRHKAKINAWWSEVEKTYVWLRPWVALAREPQRKALEESVRSIYTTTEMFHERWGMEGGFLHDLDEGKADLLEPTYRGALRELDRWAEDLRDYRIELVVKVATRLAGATSPQAGEVTAISGWLRRSLEAGVADSTSPATIEAWSAVQSFVGTFTALIRACEPKPASPSQSM